MKLAKFVAWYQKKIGTYDKQQWEKTVEQRILNGLIYVPLKNTRLKTELIDVDLVRGSSFPKAKPKQSLLTVFKLAISRFVFFPIHAKWWVEQTSPKIFVFLLSLYLLQMLNWGIYSYNIRKVYESEHIISITELVIPMALSLFLCIIHSQIVATSSIGSSGEKRKRTPHKKGQNREQIRKKKKPIRSRSTVGGKSIANGINHKSALNSHINPTSIPHASVSSKSLNFGLDTNVVHSIKSNLVVSSDEQLKNQEDQPSNRNVPGCSNIFKNDNFIKPSNGLRKRNVNWDLSIRNRSHRRYGTGDNLSRDVLQREPVVPVNNNGNGGFQRQEVTGDDDGFESLNGKSSSGEENAHTAQSIRAQNKNHRERMPQRTNVETLKTSFSVQSHPIDVKNEQTMSANENLPNLPGSGLIQKTNLNGKRNQVESTDTDEDGDDDVETFSSPGLNNSNLTEATTSATEWIGITTNSEDCSYSSELDNSASQCENSENGAEYDFAPSVILNPICGNSDRINCTIWDGRETKKAEMSVLDISSAIIERVEAMPESCDYVYIGVALSLMLAFITAFCRLFEAMINSSDTEINLFDMPVILLEKISLSTVSVIRFVFGKTVWENCLLMISLFLRISLTFLVFFVLAVAEKTFKHRFLYAKLFSHLTSSRRARKSEVPHFRLNKVRNIKTWLSVRSYLMRRGPQRSVDVIVSAAFILTLLLLAFLSVEWLKDSVQLHLQFNLEALLWACSIGCFLLRFMTLGTKINRKYRSISVLITEQINLYLQIEQKPQKKEELMVANSVLKLAADLLKELDSPFKISGLSANPYLYTTVKVVILSALSGVLSEILGFKLKLHKIKIK